MPSSALGRASRKPLLVIHVASAAGVLGADLAILAMGAASALQPDLPPLAPAAALVAAFVIQPLALTALASGLLLARISGYGGLRRWWVTAKLAIVLVLATALTLFLVPSLNRLAALDAGDGSAREVVAMIIAPAGASTLLLLAVVLGILKPAFRRTTAAPADTLS